MALTSEEIAEARQRFAPVPAETTGQDGQTGRRTKAPFIPRTNAYVTDDSVYYQGQIEPLDFKALKTADDVLRKLHRDHRNVWVISDKAAKLITRRLAKGSNDFKVKHPANDFDQTTITRGKEQWSMRMPAKLTAWGLAEKEGKKHRLLFDIPAIDAAMMAFQERFQIDVVYLASLTWLYLLDRSLSERNRATLSESPDLAPFDFNMPDLNWVRELTAEEKAKKYLHAYDKTNAYLGAVDIPLGVSAWRHVEHPTFDKKIAGVWRVRIEGDYPASLPDLRHKGKLEWLYTPTIEALKYAGVNLAVDEAYIFDDSTRLASAWCKSVRDAFTSLNLEREPDRALKAMIKTYRKGIGWLGSARLAAKGFYRPDWRNSIISEAAARMIINIVRARKLAGVEPLKDGEAVLCGLWTDCLYYVSDEPDATKATPLLSFPNSQFKHEGTFRMDTAEAQAVWSDFARKRGKMTFNRSIEAFRVEGGK